MEKKQKTNIQNWNSCRLDRRGPVYILTLTGDTQHHFNPTSMDDMLAALTVIKQSPDARALVTTNEGRYFSNGLDLKWMMQNRHLPSVVSSILYKFEGFLCSMMKMGIPTVAAICGHAAAGGFMLALAHDYRFMKKGRAVLYMSELDRGMSMPRSLMSVVRSKLSHDSLREVVLKARKFTASEAFEFGLVDGFFDDSVQTLEAAIAESEKFACKNWNRESYANLRAGSFPGVIEELEVQRDPYVLAKGSKL